MAFELITSTERYLCLSTDAKPTVGIKKSAPAKETDTGNEFIFNGVGWVAYSQPVSITGSLAKAVYAVNLSDTVDLTNGVTVGLYVGVDGDVVAITEGGTTITFANLAGGMIHPIACKRIKLTGTTATGLLAVY